jgi:hypothetical protein
MEILFVLLAPFKYIALNSAVAFIISAAFFMLCFRKSFSPLSRIIIGAVTAVWIIFAFWERSMENWRSPSGDMAIRVDIVIIGPIVTIATLAAIFVIAYELLHEKWGATSPEHSTEITNGTTETSEITQSTPPSDSIFLIVGAVGVFLSLLFLIYIIA